MFMRRSAIAWQRVLFGHIALVVALAQEGPSLGVEATPEHVAAWSLTILPDGTGLPEGSGTPETGAAIYAEKCLACHGATGTEGPSDKLVGGHGTISSDRPVRTVGSYWPYATTVFDYIRRAMPLIQPQSLTNDETYALTAYLLKLNGIIEANTIMNAETLPQVKMPNAENFVWAYAEGEE
jgi:hypothetical protein